MIWSFISQLSTRQPSHIRCSYFLHHSNLKVFNIKIVYWNTYKLSSICDFNHCLLLFIINKTLEVIIDDYWLDTINSIKIYYDTQNVLINGKYINYIISEFIVL